MQEKKGRDIMDQWRIQENKQKNIMQLEEVIINIVIFNVYALTEDRSGEDNVEFYKELAKTCEIILWH